MIRPAKRVEKEFRQHGASRARRGSYATAYTFPDGATKVVDHRTRDDIADQLIRWAHDRYGAPVPPPLARYQRARNPPVIIPERVAATPHARERIALMQQQTGMDAHHITRALLTPVRVWWAPDHNSHVWEGEYVAVAAQTRTDGSTLIRTLLWVTNEQWADNPRPAKEAS